MEETLNVFVLEKITIMIQNMSRRVLIYSTTVMETCILQQFNIVGTRGV